MAISGPDWLEVPIPYIFGLFFRPKFQDSLFPGTLWSKSWIQPLDSRFKIPRNSLEQILNPTPGFKIQDPRFPGTLWSKSWIHLESWIQDFLQRVPGNLESWILNLESWIQDLLERVPRNLESWILNPGVGFKIWIQDLLERVRRNLESWIHPTCNGIATPLQVG